MSHKLIWIICILMVNAIMLKASQPKVDFEFKFAWGEEGVHGYYLLFDLNKRNQVPIYLFVNREYDSVNRMIVSSPAKPVYRISRSLSDSGGKIFDSDIRGGSSWLVRIVMVTEPISLIDKSYSYSLYKNDIVKQALALGVGEGERFYVTVGFAVSTSFPENYESNIEVHFSDPFVFEYNANKEVKLVGYMDGSHFNKVDSKEFGLKFPPFQVDWEDFSD